MKLMIASDIHGSAYFCEKLLEAWKVEQPDKLLLLGDILYHGPRNDLPKEYCPKQVIPMLSAWADKILCVRGNCDTEVDQMVLPFPILADTALLFVDGRTWFAAHGHRAGANPSSGDLPRLPAGSVVLTGHTHIPTLDMGPDGVLLLNPGSVSIPKGGFVPSCALYEDGTFTVLSLDGTDILRIAL